MAADPHPQPLDQLFPRCRIRSSPPVDTAVLIDLSDDNHLIPNIQAAANSRMTTISATKQDSDSDASPLRRPPSLALQQQQRRFAPPLKSSELRRSSGNKMRRAKTLMDGATWTGLFDAYGTGGYEPSSDSEENDSDCSPSMKKSTASFNKRITSGSITGVRSSASESHIVGQQHWSKKTGELSSPASALVTARSRTVKEIYDLTPTRLDLSEGSGAAEGGLRDGAGEQPATRLEIAGGREVVSVSRTRNCRAASQRKRHSAAVVHNNNNNNHHNSSASASSSITRYSGEVYYEESVGRYGFHVGGGNTLWGSQGLEPTFSIPSCLNEKLPGTISHSSSSGSHASSHQGTKRPLSWAGDDGPELTLSQEPNNGESIRTEEAKTEIEERTELEARDSNNSTTEFRGYLVDFYPEMVTASEEHQVNCQTNHIEEPSTLNLDNYLSEQLNQFAQQSTNRKEPEESVTQVQPTAQQLTVATVIGGLTIAQYEGSPRRYGVRPHLPSSSSQNQDGQDEINNKSSSSSLTPAVNGSVSRPVIVPGFPRRIAPNPAQQLGTLPTFSPSTTRQTLVDLVLSPIDHNHVAQSNVLQQHNNLPWHLEPEENTDTVTLGNNNCMPTLDPADDETDLGETEVGLEVGGRSRNFTLSPETTDYDDSELDIHDPSHLPEASNNSLCMSAAVMSGSDNSCSEPGGSGKRRRGSNTQNGTGSSASVKGQFNSMPVLEDGLSSGQSSIGSDGSNSERDSGGSSVSETEEEEDDARAIHDRVPLMTGTASKTRNLVQHNGSGSQRLPANHNGKQQLWVKKLAIHSDCLSDGTSLPGGAARDATPPPPAPLAHRPLAVSTSSGSSINSKPSPVQQQSNRRLSPGPETPSSTPIGGMSQYQSLKTSPTAAGDAAPGDMNLRELDEVLHEQHHHLGSSSGRARKSNSVPPSSNPVWVPRQTNNEYWVKNSPSSSNIENRGSSGGKVHGGAADDDEERETDQLLRDPDDQGFFDAPVASSCAPTATPPTISTTSSTHSSPQQLAQVNGSSGNNVAAVSQAALRQSSEPKDLKYRETNTTPTLGSVKKKDDNSSQGKKKGRSKEVMVHEPAVLIEGVLFRANYLGSTQIVCEGQPTKYTRMMQAEEAVSRIKAPEGETQPTTEVDLFISTEKIMVLNTELKEIMMDHALRTISYIADIGDLVVLMARRRMITQDGEDPSNKIAKTPKMVCHVFESEEAQFIAQSIGQAFQVAYMEFLKANGIEDQSFVREMDYQEVLNSQEIFGDELQMFAKKELQKEVIVPKARNEILGVVIVESGWGSMLPTVVIANLAPAGAAARCGQLNIGDQIIAINGISLVGLPLSTCQTYIKNAKSATVVKLTVVPCPPVVEVKIKRPDTKYQLGFSVQNGVICSLLRGGIAERGGVRVGHRIIEINGQSVVAVPHERIVGLLATSVGEINMKTMPTSMFRLLIGQETPVYI